MENSNHLQVRRTINDHGYISPVTVLRFDKFDEMAESITSWYIGLRKPFTVIIGAENG